MKKNSRVGDSLVKWRSISVAALLILVVLLSAGSGIYAGTSFFAQQAPIVTITTTIYTTTTSWTSSTIWSTVTTVVQGILTTIEYTTSTSTVTLTSLPISSYGDTNIEATSRAVIGGYVFAATKFTTSSSTTITKLALYFSASPAGNIRFAVYRDSGGKPAGQSLVGQTGSYAIGAGVGWHTYALTSDTITINAPGTYWLCLQTDKTNVSYKGKASGGHNYAFAQPYTSGFPATFATSPISYPYGDYSFYATGSP